MSPKLLLLLFPFLLLLPDACHVAGDPDCSETDCNLLFAPPPVFAVLYPPSPNIPSADAYPPSADLYPPSPNIPSADAYPPSAVLYPPSPNIPSADAYPPSAVLYPPSPNIPSADAYPPSAVLYPPSPLPETIPSAGPSVPRPGMVPTDVEAPSPDNLFIRGLVKKKAGHSRRWLAVTLAVSISVMVVGLVLLGLFFWERRSRRIKENGVSIQRSMKEDLGAGSVPNKFSYVELFSATNKFSENQKLGKGGFGWVYKGFLKGVDSYVAVKRISKGSKQGVKEFLAEVKIISKLRHRNLVQLFGWCHEKEELLLVYEYMSNGSLDAHLFENKTLLIWEMRFKIAKGLASGLLYLHEESEQCVLHRDVKSSNVMLDEKFNAKLGDFGLAKLVDHDKGAQTTLLAGTMGYIAPECLALGKASKKSDVYSFGIVALEIACGRKSIDISVQEGQVRLVEYVWNLYGGGNLLDAVDPRLSTDFDREQMETLMIVGLCCAHPDHIIRPSIRQAILVLNFEAPLPNLPEKMPLLTHFPLPPSSSLISSDCTISASSQTRTTDYTNKSSQTKSSDNTRTSESFKATSSFSSSFRYTSLVLM